MRGCIILFTVSVLSLGTASAVFFDEYHAPLGEDFLVIHFSYGDDIQQEGIVAVPRGAGEIFPILVFFPGGAYRMIDIGDHPFGLMELHEALHCARRRIAVAVVKYRLGPDHPWPAQLIDAASAIRTLREMAPSYNLDPNRIMTMGHSSGGHLALMTGLLPPSLLGEDFPGFKGIINYSGITDFRADHAVISSIAKTLGLESDQIIKVSPSLILSEWDPPLFTLHGDSDPIIPFSQGETATRAMAEKKIQGAFLPVVNGDHTYNPHDPEKRIMPDRMTIAKKAIRFARYHLGPATGPSIYDVSGDGKIDWADFDEVCNALDSRGYEVMADGTVLGMSTNWNPFADVNRDGVIDRNDARLVLLRIEDPGLIQ